MSRDLASFCLASTQSVPESNTPELEPLLLELLLELPLLDPLLELLELELLPVPDGVAPNPKSEHSGSPWSNVSPFWHVLSRLGSQNAPAGAWLSSQSSTVVQGAPIPPSAAQVPLTQWPWHSAFTVHAAPFGSRAVHVDAGGVPVQ
jgi:hypothetical protein